MNNQQIKRITPQQQAQMLKASGKTISEIVQITGMSRHKVLKACDVPMKQLATTKKGDDK